MSRLTSSILLLSLIAANAFVRPLYRFHCRNRWFCETSDDIGGEVSQSELEAQNAELDISAAENATAVALDPIQQAIKQKETELAKAVSELENTLRSERILLAKARDRLSETGKTGYFMVQAQVADFMVCSSGSYLFHDTNDL